MAVELQFKSLGDFEPEGVAKQIEPLRQLLELRTKLSDLKNKMYGNDKLGEVLGDILANTEKLAALAKETAPKKEGE
jgi:type VI secretion system protein ImpB